MTPLSKEELRKQIMGQLIAEIAKFGGASKEDASRLARILLPHIDAYSEQREVEAPKNIDKRAVFKMLWDMVNSLKGEDNRTAGTIISRYAGMLDDRIENSGYSRSVDSLKLYTTKQLQTEIDSRQEAAPQPLSPEQKEKL